jgi:hypothetical protein
VGKEFFPKLFSLSFDTASKATGNDSKRWQRLKTTAMIQTGGI